MFLRTRFSPHRSRRHVSLTHPISAGAFAAALLAGLSVAKAGTFYWDLDGVPGGNDAGTGAFLGGTGAWDLSSPLWWDLTNDMAWGNTSADEAIFSGPAIVPPSLNTVTLTPGITANRLSFARSGYTLTGGELTLAGASPTISVNVGEFAIIDSPILGSSGLTKIGGGGVRLGNALNSYTGPTAITGGTVVIGSSSALGADTSTVTVSGASSAGGGSLLLAGSYTSGFTLSRNLSISGSGNGGGTGSTASNGVALVSVGNHTLSGLTSAPGAGTTNTGLTSALGLLTLSNVTLGGTATGNYTTFGALGSIGNYAITGVLSGTGGIQKVGGGTLIFNPTDAGAFSGTIKINRGSVRLVSSELGTNTGTGTNSTLNLSTDNGILEVRADTFNTTKNLYQSSGASPNMFIDHAVGSTVLNGTHAFATLGYDVGETLTFNGRNGYNLTFTTAPVTTGDGNVNFTNNLNGILTFTGNFWSNSNSVSRTFTVTGTGSTIISGNLLASQTTTGVDHSLTKAGTGTLTISSTGSTLDGTVNIQNGTVAIADFRSITNNTAAVNIGNTTTAAALTITGSNSGGLTTSKVINLNGTTGGATINANNTTNPVILNAAFTATGAGAKTLTLGGSSAGTIENAINGAIVNSSTADSTSVLKTDSNLWALAGTNTYTGSTSVLQGTLRLKANAATSTVIRELNSLSAPTAFNFGVGSNLQNSGGTLEFKGQNSTNNVEALGSFNLLTGANTILLSPGTSGTASLTFSTLGTVATGTGMNVKTSAGASGNVSITGPAAGFLNSHIYVDGANFARINGSSQIVAPVYGTDATFVNAAGGAATLVAANNNLVAGNITAQTSVSINSLKMTTSTLALASEQTLTVTSGGILVSGGTTTISGGTGIAAGGANDLVIRVDGSSDQLTLSSILTSGITGGLTKNGAGTLVIDAVNAQTGTTNINEGTVKLSGSGSLSAASQTTNIRTGATLDLNGLSTGTAIGQINGGGIVTNSNASTPGTFEVGNGNGAGTFSGIIQDGAGVVNVTKNGTGSHTWSGLNTYTGVTTIASTGLVSVPILANFGSASGIGKGSTTNTDAANAASLVFTGTTGGISYTGTTSVSTDRLFTMSGGGQIANASGNNSALIFNKTNPIVFGTVAAQTFTLGGTSLGDNLFNLQITDSGTGANKTSFNKIGAGLWILGNTNNNYTGNTTITAGYLNAQDGTSLPSSSGLILGATTTAGVLETSGDFIRTVVPSGSAGANTVSWNSSLTTAGSGFSASAGKLTVALGGLASPTPLTWGTNGFAVSTTATAPLIFNSTTALSEVEFRNPIILNGTTRTIQVDDNPGTFTDFATITGVISNSAGTSNINKTGTGMLQLFAANTYNGSTSVSAGTLVVDSLGNSSPGGNTSVGTATGGNTLTQAVILGNATTTAGTLVYAGPGETSDRYIHFNGTTADPFIVADGSGPLILTNVHNNAAATPTGAKDLTLRGSNMLGNQITSVLSNDGGGGALSVVHDAGGTWILTANNTYTGGTTASAGALGAGSDSAFGGSGGIPGSLTINNASIFAYGADRTLANPVTQSSTSNTIATFFGDYSLTFTGLWTDPSTSSGGRIVRNNIASGKTLTIAGEYRATAVTSSTGVTFDGSGNTVMSGPFTVVNTTTNFGFTYAGTGVFTLANSGNNYTGATNVNSGTLRLGADEVIPHAGTNPANQTVTINPAAAINAKLDLNGHSETINGLTMTPAGNATIDNTSATPASLIFGANDRPVTINPTAGGSVTITNTGSGSLSITKTGTTSLTIPAGVTLTYTGATSVIGGTMTIASPLNGTIALSSTGTGSNLNLTGGLSTPGSIVSVTVGGGAILSFLDGAGTPLPNLSGLSLGAGGGISILGLELGTSTDTLTTSTAASIANTVQFNLNGVGGIQGGTTYNLLVAPSGLLAGTYTLGSQPGGFTTGTLNMTDSLVSYTTGSAIIGTLYWNNTQTTGSWATNSGGLTNWVNAATGGIEVGYTPGPASTVVFGTTGVAGPTIATTLDANITADNLVFSSNPVGVTSVSILPGTPSTSNLTIAPSGATGIAVQANAGAVSIDANVVLGANQTWSVNGTGANGSSLTVTGIVSGGGTLTKSGAGTLTLGGVNTFGNGLTIKQGTVVGTTSNSTFGTGTITLGDTAGSNAASLQGNTSGASYPNPILLATGTTGLLSIGTAANLAAVNVTFTGGITGTNDLVINNQSVSGTTAFSTNPLNLAGKITNSSTSTGTVTISGGIGSNVKEVILNSTTSALTVSTNAVNVNSGGTILRNALGTKILTVSAAVQGTGDLILKNDSVLQSGITISGGINMTGALINNGGGTNSIVGSLISGIIGPNVTGIIQDSATSVLQLTGVNTFTSGITIKNGILEGATSGSSLGAPGTVITLGDTSGSNSASLRFQSNVTYNANPIHVVAGSSGTLSILGSRTTGATVIDSPITLAHDLVIVAGDAGATSAAPTFRGGITGTGNLEINYSATALTGAVTFSTLPLDFSGSITNDGNTTGTTTISGGVGSGVTLIHQNSTTSALTINTTALSVNSGGTTLRNSAGTKVLTVSGGVTGTGDLILQNNSNTTSGITVSTGGANHAGAIINNGTGISTSANGVLISGPIGTNVTGVIQNSPTSSMQLTGANTFTGGIFIKKGVLEVATAASSVGGAGNVITIGDTSGSDNAALRFNSTLTYDPIPITVAAGSNGTLSILSSRTTGDSIVPGAITLAHDLLVASGDAVGATTATINFTGGITGTGNLVINNGAQDGTNSSQSGGITFSSTALNMIGSITNNATLPAGTTTISAEIGSNITGVIQNSTTSGLTLTGTNNYTSITHIEAGTLTAGVFANIGMPSSLGVGTPGGSAGDIVFGGGTLRHNVVGIAATDRLFTIGDAIGNTATLDSSSTAATDTLSFTNPGAVAFGNTNAHTLTFTGTNTGDNLFAPLITNNTGATSVAKTSAGTWVLSNANTYTGGTSAGGGVLRAANNQAFGPSGTITLINTGAILELAEGITINRALTVSNTGNNKILRLQPGAVAGTYSGNITVSESTANNFDVSADTTGTLTVSGVISGTGAAGVTKEGLGIVLLSNTNTYTQPTTVNAGILSINKNAGLGTTAAGTAVNAGGSLELQGTITVGAETLSLAGPGSANNGALRNLSGTNAYGGLLTLAADATIQSDSGTLNLTNSGIITGAGFGLTLAGAGDGSVSSIIGTVGGSLTKTGAGTWTSSGANTFTGVTTIAAGTLSVPSVAANGSPQPLGQATSPIDLGSASTTGTLRYSGDTATLARDFNVAAGGGAIRHDGPGTLTLSGTLTKSSSTLTLGGGVFEITGVIAGSGAGSDLVVDAATVALSNANTYNGPTYLRNAATLNANVANALPIANGRSAVIFDGTGTSTLTLGANQSIASLTSGSTAGVNLGASVLTVGAATDSNTFGGTISGTGGSLVKDNASTQILLGVHSYTGPTTVSAGTLEIGGSISASSAVGVIGGTLILSADNAVNNTSATLTLGDSGGSTSGTLRLADSLNNASETFGPLILAYHSMLDFGNGSGGIDLLFAGVGAHTFGGSTLSIVNWNGTENVAGNTSTDRLIFSGSPGDFTTVYAPGDVSFNGVPGYATIDFGGSYEIVAVPEPSSAALLGAAGFLSLVALRKRRRTHRTIHLH